MPKLLIDGQEIEVSEGTTLIEAAQSLGIEIPRFCYHPGLPIAGNCRMCLVEVEKAPKLQISCQTTAMEGMVVQTASEKVVRAQRAVMEFLLIHHPLDCTICDKAGECMLQEQSKGYGQGASRYVERKVNFNKALDIGRHIMLDQERCINCTRCVRFCNHVTKTGELSFFQRGQHSMLGIYPGKRLDNDYSGNVVDVCPVGALTLKEFRFQNRVWYLRNRPSVCAGCARGCNIDVSVGTQEELMTTRGQGDSRIKRIVPRVNLDVNGHWICDEGRLSFLRLNAAPRLSEAQMPAGQDADWEVAIEQAAALLKEGRVGAILSPRMTSESMYAFKLLFDSLDNAAVGIRRLERGEDDELLIRADKGANSRGAAWIFGDSADEGGVLRAASQGEIDTLLVMGDPLDPDDSAPIDDDVRSKIKQMIYIGPFADAVAAKADVLLPACAWSEEDGSMVNFEGRVQRLERCSLPRGENRPGWRIAADLEEIMGGEAREWSSAGELFTELAGAVKEYAGSNGE
jgi:NADH-quinone oxidoreductase subunit G